MTARSSAVSYLASLLLVCVVVEFGALRVLLRSGPALEGGRLATTTADTLVLVGHTAMNLAVAVGLVLLAVLGVHFFAMRALIWRASAGALWMLALTLAVVLVDGSLLRAGLAITAALAIVVIVLTIAGAASVTRPAVVLAVIGGGYVALFAHYALQSLAGAGIVSIRSLPAFYVGEGLVLSGAVASLLLVDGAWSARRIAVGVVAGLGFVVAHGKIAWLVSTMGIWNFGTSMSFPAVLYGAALACYTTAVLHLWTTKRRAAVALLFIALGGTKLDLVYASVLGISGFTLLALWVAERERRAPIHLGHRVRVGARAAAVQSNAVG